MSHQIELDDNNTQRFYAQTMEHDDTLDRIEMFEGYEMFEAMCIMERLRLEEERQ
jgi:hypothetical protein